MRPRALSMLETVIATFVLLCGFLVIINLFHSGLGYSARIENQQLAATVAERYVEQLRVWSDTPAGLTYNFDNLATIYNTAPPETPSDYGQFSITTQVVAQTLYSACSEFELGVAAGGGSPRKQTRSAQNVKVTVSWDGGLHRLSLSSLLVAPATSFSATSPVNVTILGAPPLPLAPNATINLQAIGYDVNNQPIPDLFFQWDVVSLGGSATLSFSRDGTAANLTNVIVTSTGATMTTGGCVTLTATARYRGQTASGSSPVIPLQ